MATRRKSSFFEKEEIQQYTCFYTIVLCVFSFIGLFLALFSSSFTKSSRNLMFDKRFGACPVYKCNKTHNKLAVVLAVYENELGNLTMFFSRLQKKTIVKTDKELVDLFIFPISPYSNNPKKIVTTIETLSNDFAINTYFSNVHVLKPFADVYNFDDLLRQLFINHTIFSSHCFIQVLSLKTHFLRKHWLDAIVSRSLNAFSQNFWMKGPIDMSFRPFSRYENIEVSLCSIYAIHNSCFADLLDYTFDEKPNSRISKALTELLRDPMRIRLAHWLAPRILPTSIGVDFGSTKTSIQMLRYDFPDAYFAEGNLIYE